MEPIREGCEGSGRKTLGDRRKPNLNSFSSEPPIAVELDFPLPPLAMRSNNLVLARSPLTISLASSIISPLTGSYRIPSRLTISLNSLVVNATWAGPLLPTTSTRLTRDFLRCSMMGVGMSVLINSEGGLRRILAQSTATFPWPTTVTCSPLRSGARCVYAG